MQIKKLSLFGFKSFADRTEFEFDEGVTCVVGPNGCGKSNIVDAVKWILGDQSAKSLRGSEMADVIFNGSGRRHPLGFAEATLVVDNASRRLPVDLAEVAVTRRLYRSGESEYMINRKLCRLRDIREIFMDTGVGLNAYSLIEQGKVDVLLQSNPQQRRGVFEEAAGISKYKAKKKEAIRKLDRTEQNLLRLGDIVDEVRRRLRSVKYQAGKARNWQAYNDRLKELRITHALHEYSRLHEAAEELAERRQARDDERAELDGRVATLEARRSELDASLVGIEDELRQADAELAELKGNIASAESDITFNRTRIEEWNETRGRDRRRISELDARLRELDGQIAEASEAARHVESELAALREQLDRAEHRLVEAQSEGRQRARELEEAKGSVVDLQQESAQLRNDLGATDLRAENLAASRERLQRRRGEIAEQLQRLAEQKDALDGEIADLDFAIRRDEQRLKVKRDEAKALTEEAEAVAGETAAAKEYRSGLVSRKQLLQDLEHRGEGLEEGVRRVLELREQGLFPGVRGIVAELIDVDTRYAAIIEAAVGDAEQYLVIDRREDVVESLEALEETLDGRAGFLPLDHLAAPGASGRGTFSTSDPRGNAAAATRTQPESCPGVVARAADLVRSEPSLQPVVECLLGGTVVVENLAAALELAAGPLAGARLVTLSGEVVEPDGRMSLGRLTARGGLISRKSELKDLDGQLAEVDERIARLGRRSDDVSRRLHDLDEQQRELRSLVYDASTSRVDRVAQKRRLAEAAEALRGEEPVVLSELEAVDRDTAALAERRKDLQERLEQTEQRTEEARRAVEQLNTRVAEGEAERARLEEQRTQQRVELARVDQQRRNAEDRLGHLRTARSEAGRNREDTARELAASGNRIRDAERTILRTESRMASLFLEKESVAEHCRELDHRRHRGREQVAELQEEVHRFQEQLHEVEAARHELDMQINEQQLKMSSLRDRIREDFDMDLDARLEGYAPESVDWEAIEEEIQSLRTKIERLGTVNLEAIDEQQQLEQRQAFLSRQQEDLEQARTKLENLIERINRESITRFTETFERVRENFQALFRKLFGGGKADVVLLDPEDVLESGIEVVARPPGKEPCSISLLSGGEKSLTAVALLMAVFRSKPSPFCILDEVDAALDEANNERFNGVIQEFVKDSQFIIITHSKRTMARADMLYGVTMQEPGVSKKISVRFADVHRLNLDDAGEQREHAAGV